MNKDIRETIIKFRQDVETHFGKRVLDIVLYGSIIRGGFNQNHSDIDFIVLINQALTMEDMNWIKMLHMNYRLSKELSALLEGRYIALDQEEFSNGYYVGTKVEGWEPLYQIGYGPLERAMILDCFESLYQTSTITKLLHYQWEQVGEEIKNQIDDFINNDLLITNEAYKNYALITASRSLYTYIYKGFLSKNDAVRWVEVNYFKLDDKNPKDYLFQIQKVVNNMGRHEW